MNASVALLLASNRKVALNSAGFIHAWLPPQLSASGSRSTGASISDGFGAHALTGTSSQGRNTAMLSSARANTHAHSPRATSHQERGNTICGCPKSDGKYEIVGWFEEFDRYNARDHYPGSFCVLLYRLDKSSNRMLACVTSLRHVIDEGRMGWQEQTVPRPIPQIPCPYLSRRDKRLLIWTLSSQKNTHSISTATDWWLCNLGRSEWVTNSVSEMWSAFAGWGLKKDVGRWVSRQVGLRAFAEEKWNGPIA